MISPTHIGINGFRRVQLKNPGIAKEILEGKFSSLPLLLILMTQAIEIKLKTFEYINLIN